MFQFFFFSFVEHTSNWKLMMMTLMAEAVAGVFIAFIRTILMRPFEYIYIYCLCFGLNESLDNDDVYLARSLNSFRMVAGQLTFVIDSVH